MNKQDLEIIRKFMADYIEEYRSANTYRMAWTLMQSYPHLAVAIIKEKLLEIKKGGEE